MHLLHGRIASLRYIRSFAYRINMFQLLRSVRVAFHRVSAINQHLSRDSAQPGS